MKRTWTYSWLKRNVPNAQITQTADVISVGEHKNRYFIRSNGRTFLAYTTFLTSVPSICWLFIMTLHGKRAYYLQPLDIFPDEDLSDYIEDMISAD